MISKEQQDKPSEREWRERAACRNEPPELFFPTAESGLAYRAQVAEAKAVCGRCPVRADCLAEALARIPYGIAGGLTEHERQRLRTGTRTSTTAREGSRGGNRAPLRIAHRHNPRQGHKQRKKAEVAMNEPISPVERVEDEQLHRSAVAALCEVARRAQPGTTGQRRGPDAAERDRLGSTTGVGDGGAAATGLPADLRRRRRPSGAPSSERTPSPTNTTTTAPAATPRLVLDTEAELRLGGGRGPSQRWDTGDAADFYAPKGEWCDPLAALDARAAAGRQVTATPTPNRPRTWRLRRDTAEVNPMGRPLADAVQDGAVPTAGRLGPICRWRPGRRERVLVGGRAHRTDDDNRRRAPAGAGDGYLDRPRDRGGGAR